MKKNSGNGKVEKRTFSVYKLLKINNPSIIRIEIHKFCNNNKMRRAWLVEDGGFFCEFRKFETNSFFLEVSRVIFKYF